MHRLSSRRFAVSGWLLPGALLLLAAVPRLLEIDLVSITADEGIHGLFAMNVALFRNPPIVGLPSVGIRNSALFIYLLSVPYFVVWQPLAGVVFVAGLNLVAVYLAYRLAREWFGAWAAIIATVLYATSPWAVLYARNMWPPSCVAVVALWVIRTALAWLERGAARHLLLLTLLAFVVPQVHFSGFSATLWVVAVLAAGRKRLSEAPQRNALLLGILLGIVSWLPWIYFQVAINNWIDVQQALRTAKGNSTAAITAIKAVTYFAALLESGHFDYWFGVAPADLPEYFQPPLLTACSAAGVMLIGAWCAALVWAVLPPADRIRRLLALWTVLPILLLLVVRPNMHPHYVLVAFPLPFVLIGAMAGRWIEQRPRPLFAQCLAVVIITAIGLVHLSFLVGWLRFLENGRTSGAGHFELSYRQRRSTVDSLFTAIPMVVEAGIGGFFTGQNPAYFLVYNYEQIRQRLYRRGIDKEHIFWIDEERGAELNPGAFEALREWDHFAPCTVVKHWRVGPSRVFLLRRGSNARQ